MIYNFSKAFPQFLSTSEVQFVTDMSSLIIIMITCFCFCFCFVIFLHRSFQLHTWLYTPKNLHFSWYRSIWVCQLILFRWILIFPIFCEFMHLHNYLVIKISFLQGLYTTQPPILMSQLLFNTTSTNFTTYISAHLLISQLWVKNEVYSVTQHNESLHTCHSFS